MVEKTIAAAEKNTVAENVIAENTAEKNTATEYKPPQGSEAFLIECMKEGLNQARHVENERMLFVTLFAALAGGVLAVVSQMPDAWQLACLLVGILILLNLLCTFLVLRWNKVYSEHMRIAKKIYTQILSPPDANAAPLPENEYYYFDNRYNAKLKRQKKFYVTTGWQFIIYNCIVLGILLFVLKFFWEKLPPV